MHQLKGLILLSLILLLTSCEIINPKEDLPGYIRVQNPQVLVDSTAGFYSSLGIKDVWAYQEGNLLGAFSIPGTFPYLNVEKGNFTLDGGVYESGLSSFRLPYPFWNHVNFTVTQNALDTIVVEPVFTYLNQDYLTVAFEENFEDFTTQFNPILTLDTANFFRTSSKAFQGNYSGVAHFAPGADKMEIVSDQLPYIHRNVDAWCEVTYNTDVPFAVGIYWLDGAPSTASEVTFSPTNGEWKTVYVHMTTLIRNTPDNASTQKGIWIKALPESATGSLYLDNIRLIHFK
ncbi:MAG: hypothetical protein H6581_01175 [Bacteroidia bacterium]|nr:hypothetical protein [Bacteroidia bacterium]